jgi:hypothetical protein
MTPPTDKASEIVPRGNPLGSASNNKRMSHPLVVKLSSSRKTATRWIADPVGVRTSTVLPDTETFSP